MFWAIPAKADHSFENGSKNVMSKTMRDNSLYNALHVLLL